jgi:hypothetical protein
MYEQAVRLMSLKLLKDFKSSCELAAKERMRVEPEHFFEEWKKLNLVASEKLFAHDIWRDFMNMLFDRRRRKRL